MRAWVSICVWSIAVGLSVAIRVAEGQEAPVPEAMLDPVVVSAPPAAASSSEQLIPGRDFELRPPQHQHAAFRPERFR